MRALSPPSTLPEEDTAALFRLYAVLVLVKGEATTAADVHDAWAAWKAERDPQNPLIRPFSELDEAMRRADEPFAAAIRTVASGMSADEPRSDYLKG